MHSTRLPLFYARIKRSERTHRVVRGVGVRDGRDRGRVGRRGAARGGRARGGAAPAWAGARGAGRGWRATSGAAEDRPVDGRAVGRVDRLMLLPCGRMRRSRPMEHAARGRGDIRLGVRRRGGVNRYAYSGWRTTRLRDGRRRQREGNSVTTGIRDSEDSSESSNTTEVLRYLLAHSGTTCITE
ncbi:Protein of unknown function [Gryllus bimaculatus]|nr:Protein of unknown function [Gryllus bimaculatus]